MTVKHDSHRAIDDLAQALAACGYLAGDRVAMALHLARALDKPILVEGPPGVGKTALALAAAQVLELPLVRLQCYEGLDESRALYEWKYGKQLLYTQLLRDQLASRLGDAADETALMQRLQGVADRFYDRSFLEPRPLLQALEAPTGAVLLIDEIDKSDPEFEALLLELLADYQVTIPELGTVRAGVPPLVLLTSNNSRELSEALKRRCLHLHLAYPDSALERRIVRSRLPDIGERLNRQLVDFVQVLRTQDLKKPPAVSETLDWARALVLLHAEALSPEWVRDTLNLLLKEQEDVVEVVPRLPELLAGGEG